MHKDKITLSAEQEEEEEEEEEEENREEKKKKEREKKKAAAAAAAATTTTTTTKPLRQAGISAQGHSHYRQNRKDARYQHMNEYKRKHTLTSEQE